MPMDDLPSQITLDPADWKQVRAQGHRMLDDMFDYLEHIRERPVWQPIPEAVRMQFHAAQPQKPSDLAAVHDEFMRLILPYSVGNPHPGFMGWVHGGGTVNGMLAEMLAAGLNANLGGRDHMPAEVEHQITEWTRQWFGFPKGATGLFVTGTSMANLIALLVARGRVLGLESRRQGVSKGLTAYASSATHSCVAKAMDIAGLGTDALRVLPVDDHHRMDLGLLRAAIIADRAAGLTPFLVVGTAGTVEIGGIDDLAGLADLCKAEDLWFHVDGAFGALGILAPGIAPRLHGIERADSIAFDFHKWAQVPYDAGFVLVRDGAQHLATFATPAAYLRRETRGLAAGSPWPCDFGPDLSRGFRALKTWVTLKTYGTDALGAVITRTCELAQYLKGLVEAEPRLELAAPVQLNIVCFRYRSRDPDRVNAAIVADLQESGIAAPSATTLNGQIAIRAAIVNHRTGPHDLEALVAGVLKFGARYEPRP